MSVTMDQMKELLIDTFDLEMELSEITESTEIVGEGLELDSVDTLEILVAVSKKFGVKIPNGDLKAETFSTVGTLTEFVNKY